MRVGARPVMSDWQQLLDEDSGAYYFFNPRTGASSWEEPAGWNESKDAAASKSDAPPPASYAVAPASSSASPSSSPGNTSAPLASRLSRTRSAVVQQNTRKKVKHVPWTKVYTYNGLKPWPCPLCEKVNRSAATACGQCGKQKPYREPLEEVAARRIQCALRQHQARVKIGALVLRTYDKVWDSHSKRYVYRNKVTSATSLSKPRFLQVDDIPLSKIQEALAAGRHEREAAQQARQRTWAVEQRHAADEEARLVIEKWDGLWAPYFKEARKVHKLIFCWKGVDRFHDDVFDMGKLTCVRLIGNKLRTLPDSLFTSLPLLEQLSFSNNQLVSLPDTIGSLKHLKEINLLKNELTELPDSFCNLKALETVELSSNKLTSLPERFGALSSLRNTLAIENNALTGLPESLGLLQITGLRLTMNEISVLPQSLKMMQQMRSVVLNINALVEFPRGLCDLVNLENLSLCKNKITIVPEAVGNMTALRDLRLDWNDIEELPTETCHLASLHSISMNGNPMRRPTMDIIAQGPEVVKQWCATRAEFNRMRKRRACIKDLQRLFRAVVDVGITNDPDLKAYFDEEAHPKESSKAGTGTWRDSMGGGYYSFAHDVLFKEILPRMERVAGRLPQTQATAKNGVHRAVNFEWEPEEVEDALTECNDACGKISYVGLKLMFRSCRCMRKGRRRVCVPPRKGYLCRRANAALLKKRLVTEAEYRGELSNQQEMERVASAAAIARGVAMQYIKSEDGQKDMARRALDKSAAALYADKKRVYIEKMSVAANKKYAHDCKQRDNMMAALKKSRQHRIDEIEAEKKELSLKLERLRGWEAKKCQEKFDKCETALKNIPEDDEIELLQEQMDEAPGLFAQEMDAIKDGEGFEQKASRQKVTKQQKKFAKEIRKQVEDEYCKVLEEEAAGNARQEFRLMRKIGTSWTQGALRRVFQTWASFAKDSVENRLILAAFEEEAAEVAAAGEENEEKLLAMEAAKWEEGYDPYAERYFYTHCETGEVVWDEKPLDREFVLRVK